MSIQTFFTSLAITIFCIFGAPVIIYIMVKTIVTAFYNAKQEAGQEKPRNGDERNGDPYSKK